VASLYGSTLVGGSFAVTLAVSDREIRTAVAAPEQRGGGAPLAQALGAQGVAAGGGGGGIHLAGRVEHHAVQVAGALRGAQAGGHVGGDTRRIARQRIAVAAAASASGDEGVARAKQRPLLRRERLDPRAGQLLPACRHLAGRERLGHARVAQRQANLHAGRQAAVQPLRLRLARAVG